MRTTKDGQQTGNIKTDNFHVPGGFAPRETVAVKAIQARWDAKMACLNGPDAAERLASAMNGPLDLESKVRAGEMTD